jgi:hypothetical protein
VLMASRLHAYSALTVLVLQFVVLLSLGAAPAGAQSRYVQCGAIPYSGGGRVHVEKQGRVSCGAARRLAAAIYAGKGTTTGGPSGSSYRTRYHGWLCYGDHVACHRNNPWAWVYAM